MDLTVVCSYFPLPQDRGDPVRVLMMLRAIASQRDYTLMVVRRPTTTDEHVVQLREMLAGVTVLDYQATPYTLGRMGPVGRFAEAWAAGCPPWVRTRYSRELHEALAARTGMAVAIGEAAGAYFPSTSLSWHWDKANVLAASAPLAISEASNLPYRARALHLARVSKSFEERALSFCRSVSVTSQEEAERLAAVHGRRADLVIPSCVPLPERYERRPQPGELVWLGSLAYESNVAGLIRFLGSAWSRLRQEGFTLKLVGSGLSEGLKQDLEGYDGVTALGFVDDLRPVLAGASAAVVPIWSGAGVKLKTVTLLAHGVPVFSTPAGAEGIPPTEGMRVLDTPAELAKSIIASTADDLTRMSRHARELVAADFSEQAFERSVRSLFEDDRGFATPAEPRHHGVS